jgi:hypothetical protein
MNIDGVNRHICAKDERWMEYDGRGIPLTYVCSTCQQEKLAKYRPEILEFYTQEDVDEPIEEEEY